MRDDIITLSKEASVLKKLTDNFAEIKISNRGQNKSNSMATTELVNGLNSVDNKLVPPILGYVLTQYLENHPDSLERDEGFATLVYYLRAVEGISNELTLNHTAEKTSDLMQVLAEFSTSQLNVVIEWICVAHRWTCSRRFRFDLEEAQEAWSRYLTWRKAKGCDH